jgi:DME family drug/metabolite transporter
MKIPASVDINEARVAVAALLFGSSGVAAQLLAPGLPAVTTAGWRVVLGGAVLVGLSNARCQAPWRYSLRWRVTLPGAVAFLVFQLGFFLSVSLAGVATATIVTIGTGPVVAGLLDRVCRGTPLRRRWWIGVGVALLGTAVTTGAGAVTLNPAGLASAMIAGCCFPVFGSAIRDLTTDRPTLTAAATVFGAAIIPAAVLLAIAGSNPAATSGTITALLYLGVVTTAIAYALWSAGLARLTLANTVTLTMLEPVAATVLAIAVLGESAGPTTILGIATTLAGVWIASTVPSRQFAAIGIVKGETVAPDPGYARSWDEAVAFGNAASRALGMGAHRPVTSAASRVRVLGGKCFSSGGSSLPTRRPPS